ncbi:MAG TPA: FAD binding domain-containing protein [Candidatus Poseidoniaceae archaeon]|nr:FAD binding domain-containing protein [Candidatus Poseidoniaceae archaeon]
MKTPPFKLFQPTTIEEAMDLSSKFVENGEQFDWVAGGTDLLPNYKWHLNTKPNVISLASIEELFQLDSTHIGAMVRLHDLANSEHAHSIIKKSAASIASVLIRQSGTVGGNIALDTRCFWFNQAEEWRRSIEWCHKCDCDSSADCRVIPNQNELCVATYQADLAPSLLVLNAQIHLCGPDGLRDLPLSEFFELDGIKRNVLKPGEIITHVKISEDAKSWSGDYQKLCLRESWDFPEAGVAAAWKNENGFELRIATTALESIPRLHNNITNEVIINDSMIDDIASKLRQDMKPVNNTSFPPNYRKKMVEVLCKKVLDGLKGEIK